MECIRWVLPSPPRHKYRGDCASVTGDSCNGKTGGMGEFIVASYNEGIEFILRVQVCIFIIDIKGAAEGGLQILSGGLVLPGILLNIKETS